MSRFSSMVTTGMGTGMGAMGMGTGAMGMGTGATRAMRRKHRT